jgi:hypothetical protein
LSPILHCAGVFTLSFLFKVTLWICVDSQCTVQTQFVPLCSHSVFCPNSQFAIVFTVSVLSKVSVPVWSRTMMCLMLQGADVFTTNILDGAPVWHCVYTHCSVQITVCLFVHTQCFVQCQSVPLCTLSFLSKVTLCRCVLTQCSV